MKSCFRGGFLVACLVVLFAGISIGVTDANASGLSSTRIGKILSGNSIVHPVFGCLFYRPDGTTLQVARSGATLEGRWRVRGDVYFSSGQCGRAGCHLVGQYPNLVFRRLDGGYEQPAHLILGNHCEKNGLFS